MYEIPPYARHSLSEIGIADAADSGFGTDAFGVADGVYVEQLMRRVDAPLPSRWLSIALRRLLLSRVTTPARVNGADFAAERAWLLLRMGEAPAARAIVQSVDTDRYTPKLFQVAMQTALANGDPAALCPIADGAADRLDEPGWVLARAMCAGPFGRAGDCRSDPGWRAQPPAGRGHRPAARRKGDGGRIERAPRGHDPVGRGRSAQRMAVRAGARDRRRHPPTSFSARSIRASSFGRPPRRWRRRRHGWSPPTTPRRRACCPISPQSISMPRSTKPIRAIKTIWSRAICARHIPIPALESGCRRCASCGASRRREPVMAGLCSPRAPPPRSLHPISPPRMSDRLVAAMLSAGLDRSAQRWLSRVEPGSDAWAMLALARPDGRARGGVRRAGLWRGQGADAVRRSGRPGPPFDVRHRAAVRGAGGAAGARGFLAARDRPCRDGGTARYGPAPRRAGHADAALDRSAAGDAVSRRQCAVRATGQEGLARMVAAEAIARL